MTVKHARRPSVLFDAVFVITFALGAEIAMPFVLAGPAGVHAPPGGSRALERAW